MHIKIYLHWIMVNGLRSRYGQCNLSLSFRIWWYHITSSPWLLGQNHHGFPQNVTLSHWNCNSLPLQLYSFPLLLPASRQCHFTKYNSFLKVFHWVNSICSYQCPFNSICSYQCPTSVNSILSVPTSGLSGLSPSANTWLVHIQLTPDWYTCNCFSDQPNSRI